MKKAACFALLTALPIYEVHAQVKVPEYQLEQVVTLTRHGVRPQTDTQKLNEATGKQWPVWQVPDGHLSERGYEGMVDQGRYQYEQWLKAGLPIHRACPTKDDVLLWSSTAQRTKRTADAMSKGMFKDCNFPVGFTKQSKDPMFHTFKLGLATHAFPEIEKEFYKRLGSQAKTQKKYQKDIELLKSTVCAPGSCTFLTEDWALKKGANDAPKLKGPTGKGAMIGETIRLQYSENMPLSDVAFGHVKSAKDVKKFLGLHQAKWHYLNEIPAFARAGGSLLLQEMLNALNSQRPLTMFVGHDTNISQIQTMLGFNWQLPDYPVNDIPPGGTLAFAKYKQVKTGKEFVKISFSARTLDQWRNLTTLDQNNQLSSQDLKYRYCKKTNVGVLCPLDKFVKQAQKQIVPIELKQPLFQ